MPVYFPLLPIVSVVGRIVLVLSENNTFLAFHIRFPSNPQPAFDHVGGDQETGRYDRVISQASIFETDGVTAGQGHLENMISLAFIVAFLIGLDFSKGPFDTLECGITPILRHADVRSCFRIPVVFNVCRNTGAEHLATILDFTDGLRPQENRDKEEKNDDDTDAFHGFHFLQ